MFNQPNFARMKVVELLKISGEVLKVMSKHGVRRDDYRFVKMFDEYHVMRENGVKHTAVIAELSVGYGVSTRTVERVLKRLGIDC